MQIDVRAGAAGPVRVLTIGSLPPEWGGPLRGGAATFHAALLTELGRRRDVELVGVLPPGPLNREIPVSAWVRPEGVGRASFYEELLDRLRPDAVLMNHVAHTIGATHARLGSSVPAVGVVHSWHNITFRSGAERRRAEELTQEALGGLACTVAVSRHMLEEGRRLGLAYGSSVEVIHNPVPDLYMSDSSLPTERERDGVVFLGSLIERKQPAALVEAAALLPGLRVLLVGHGDREAALRARVAELGLGDRVRIAEPPPGDGHLAWVRRALLHCRVMCLPSDSEGLPLAFVEALSCGTPIVGFGPALREIRDLLGIEIGEPLDGSGHEQLAAALERVLVTDWNRERMRRLTVERFGLDRTADRYVQLFAEVAGGRREVAESPPVLAKGRAGLGHSPAAPGEAPVCVLGMSRGGTSLTTRLLNLAGVYLGSEDELLGEGLRQLSGEGEAVLAKARESNPGGHWEHYRLMRLNERVLRTLGGSWREPPALPPGWEGAAELGGLREQARAILAESFAGHDLWGWKDPRTSLTLPFWHRLLPSARYVICVRHPREVAESLRDRDGIELGAGIEHWTRYLAAALANTAGRPRLVVRYEDYFRDPAAVAARLACFIGRPAAFDGPGGRSALAGAIDPGLWRRRLADCVRGPALPTDTASLLRIAELLGRDGEEPDERRGRLEAAADVYAEGVLQRVAPAPAAPVS